MGILLRCSHLHSAEQRAGSLIGASKISLSQAGVGIVTVRQVEAGATEPRRSTLVVLRQAFERAGVEFIDENGGGPGVRLRKRQRAKSSK